MPDIEKQAYDIKSFCKAYSVSRSFTYLEISAGRLKIFKLGRKTLISRESAEAWLKAREHGPPADGSEAQLPAFDKRPPGPIAREEPIKAPPTTPRQKPSVQHRATQAPKSQRKQKRVSPASQRRSYPAQRGTQAPTQRRKARNPWYLRPLFSDWRNDERYEQLIDDLDPRLVIYVWRVNEGVLVRPHLYKGPLYQNLFNDLRVEHHGGEFALMIRRGETMLLAGGFAIAPLSGANHRVR